MDFRVILILLLASYVTASPFQPVSSSCIYWDFLNLYPNGDTETLHCILDEKNQLGIVNVAWKWVQQGSCPYYDRYSKQIHVKPCDAKIGGCPEKDFFSYQAVKYKACVETNIRNVDNPDEQGRNITPPMIHDCNRHSETLPAINVAVSFIAVFILIILVVIQIKPKLKRWKTKRKEDIPNFDVNIEQDGIHGSVQLRREGDYYSYIGVPSRTVS